MITADCGTKEREIVFEKDGYSIVAHVETEWEIDRYEGDEVTPPWSSLIETGTDIDEVHIIDPDGDEAKHNYKTMDISPEWRMIRSMIEEHIAQEKNMLTFDDIS